MTWVVTQSEVKVTTENGKRSLARGAPLVVSNIIANTSQLRILAKANVIIFTWKIMENKYCQDEDEHLGENINRKRQKASHCSRSPRQSCCAQMEYLSRVNKVEKICTNVPLFYRVLKICRARWWMKRQLAIGPHTLLSESDKKIKKKKRKVRNKEQNYLIKHCVCVTYKKGFNWIMLKRTLDGYLWICFFFPFVIPSTCFYRFLRRFNLLCNTWENFHKKFFPENLKIIKEKRLLRSRSPPFPYQWEQRSLILLECIKMKRRKMFARNFFLVLAVFFMLTQCDVKIYFYELENLNERWQSMKSLAIFHPKCVIPVRWQRFWMKH